MCLPSCLIRYRHTSGRGICLTNHQTFGYKQECDEVLKSVEAYLFRFQTDLGSVSSEIESLQSRSTYMNLQLENRRSLEKALTPAIQNVTMTSKAARIITNEPVNEVWVSALSELDSKIAFVDAMEQKENKAQAIGDAKPFLTDLQEKVGMVLIEGFVSCRGFVADGFFQAIEKIRGYLNAQLRALKSPASDITGQQKDLLRSRPLYDFLRKHRLQLADSFCQAYVNNVKSHFFSRFNDYGQSMEKIKLWTMDKSELLGNESSSKCTSDRTPRLKACPYKWFLFVNVVQQLFLQHLVQSISIPSSLVVG